MTQDHIPPPDGVMWVGRDFYEALESEILMGEAKQKRAAGFTPPTAQQQKQAAALALMAALMALDQEFVTKGILQPMELATGLRLYADEVMSRGSFVPFGEAMKAEGKAAQPRQKYEGMVELD